LSPRLDVPERLVRFVPAEWPHAMGVWEAFEDWKAARRAYLEAYGSGTSLGDFVEVLRVERATRLRLADIPDPPARRS
jgi:hypothetical protein